MKDVLTKLPTRSIRSGVICLGLLATTLGIGLGIANAIGTGIGMPTRLSITHQPPSTIEPWLDLVLSFSISGDCEGDRSGAYAYGDLRPETGLRVSKGCGPLSGTVTYDFGTGQSTATATFAPRDSQGLRAGTVTIPGSGLPSGATVTYTINSRQSRTYTTTQGGAGGECVDVLSTCVPLPPAPFAHTPTESDTIATASKSATIKISGEPSPKAPSAPTLSAAAVAGDCCINLTWTAASPNGAPVTNYKLYRGTSSSMLSSIGTFGNISNFSDRVSQGITYYYAVSGLNSYGEGVRSNVASALISSPPQPPQVPQAAYVYWISPTPTGLMLYWEWNRTKDGGAPVTKFKIYRDTGSGERSLLTTINEVKIDSYNIFHDTQVVDGKYYTYWVNAVSAVGEGPFGYGKGARAYIGTPTAPVILTSNPPKGSVQPANFVVSGTAATGMNVRLYRNNARQYWWESCCGETWAFNAGRGWEGKATYYVTALSPNGRESVASNSITVDIDSVLPSGRILGTFGGTSARTLIGGTLVGDASDNRSVREVRLTYYQSGTGALVREGTVTSCACGGPSATWSDSPNLPPGAYAVDLIVYDVAGNSSSRRYSFNIFGIEIP